MALILVTRHLSPVTGLTPMPFVYDRTIHFADTDVVGVDFFALAFELTRLGPAQKLAGRARPEHACISSRHRQRAPLPPALAASVQAG